MVASARVTGAPVAAAMVGLVLALSVGRAAVPPGRLAPRPADSDPVVARVDGKPIRLSEAQVFQHRSMERYRQETGNVAPPAYDSFFLRIGLEEIVRQRLVDLDARARGLLVSDAQADSLMRRDPGFQTKGAFDAARYGAYRTANPRGFADAREQARSQLLFQRQMRSLERQFEPGAAELAAAARARDLRARVRYVLVSELHYDGVHDPTDEELRAFYEQNKDQLAPPAELAFTAATVTWPADDARRGVARARADSLLAAARAGTVLDSLLGAPGVLPSSGVWRPGATEGLFATKAPLAESAFALEPGSILPNLVESKDGLAIVRIDRAQPRVVPPLSQIALDLRARWRAQKTEAEEADLARRYFEAHTETFSTPTWQVRWALIDSSRLAPPSPGASDLKTWYERHQAEFTRLLPAGGVETRPYAEVSEQVARRWRAETLALQTRKIADDLASAWGMGRNGPESRAATLGGPAWIVQRGALPAGLSRELADSARAWDRGPRALVVEDRAGYAVVALMRYEPRAHAAFEVVAPRARELAAVERRTLQQAGALAWYDAHLAHFRTGPGYELSYVASPPPPTTRVDLPGERVERYYRQHPDEFSTPPEVHVRHILIMTNHRSDDAARELATRIRLRARRGDDFAALAREFSEDPGTKEQGGDLGFIGRGATVPPFERAAFALTAAQPLSDVVRSQFGYHILQLVEGRGGRLTPFEEVRGTLGQRLAIDYADTLARRGAERLQREATDRDDLMARANQRSYARQQLIWYEGQPLAGPTMLDDLRADMLNTRPGSILPRTYRYLTQGYVVAVLDTILPPRQLAFDEVKDRVLQEQQSETGARAMRDRADRLAHDLASGMPWDRAIETVGGETTTPLLVRGAGLPSLGPVAGLDSLLFGPGADTLAVGGWRRLGTPRGELFVQLLERSLTEASQAPAARAQLRATVLNRRLYDYIERLRERYPVQVLRKDLAERIPPPPAL